MRLAATRALQDLKSLSYRSGHMCAHHAVDAPWKTKGRLFIATVTHIIGLGRLGLNNAVITFASKVC